MSRLTRVLLALAAVAFPALAGQGIDPRLQAALQQLDTHLAAAFQAQNLVGMSAGVVYDRDIIWTKGYGYANWSRKIPADSKSVYDIGSIAKVFNATALLLLRDAGRLSLDDPIEKYLPEFKCASRYPDPKPPTFRQVVAHVGGLPRDFGVDEGEKTIRQPPAAEVLKSLRQDCTLVYSPFTRLHYSNLGVCLIGQALGRVSGQSYPQYVTEHIIRPLEMRMTGWDLTEEMKAHQAIGYWPAGAGGNRGEGPVWLPGDFGHPAGGLYTNVEDLAKFVILQWQDGSAGAKQILSGTTLREMRSPVFLADDWREGYGVGWSLSRVAGVTTVGHGGGHAATASFLSFVPDLRVGLVLLINQAADQYSVGHKALELLIPAFQAVEAARRAKARAALLDQLAGHLGPYVFPAANVKFELGLRDGKLLLSMSVPGEQPPPFELEPEEGGVLRIIRGVGYNAGEIILAARNPLRGTPQLRFGNLVFDRP